MKAGQQNMKIYWVKYKTKMIKIFQNNGIFYKNMSDKKIILSNRIKQ